MKHPVFDVRKLYHAVRAHRKLPCLLKKKDYIDLHLHSTASDGTDTPGVLIQKAFDAGLKGVALTDHDTVEGLRAALTAGKRLGIPVFPGIEFSIDMRPQDIHILGIGIDFRNKSILKLLQNMKDTRATRAQHILKKLRKLGIKISYKELLMYVRVSATRTHIARAMYEKGYINDVREAFEHYIGRGRPCFVERPYFKINKITETIKSAGGLSFMAHPGLYRLLAISDLKKMIIDNKIDGIECYYPLHTAAQTKSFLKLAEELKLYVTGGSDYHGKAKKIRLGEFKVLASKIAKTC